MLWIGLADLKSCWCPVDSEHFLTSERRHSTAGTGIGSSEWEPGSDATSLKPSVEPQVEPSFGVIHPGLVVCYTLESG